MSKSATVQGAVLHPEALEFIKEIQESNNDRLKRIILSITRATDKLIQLGDFTEDFGRDTQNALANLVDLKKDLALLSSEKGGLVC